MAHKIHSSIKKIQAKLGIRNRLAFYLLAACVGGLAIGLALQGFALATNGSAYFEDSQQITVLFVGVDSLNEKGDLEAVWLGSYLPGVPVIHFSPIYPNGLGFSERQLKDLAESLSITEDQAPGTAFFKQLNRMGISYWDAYLVMDGLAISNLMSTFKQIEYRGQVYLPAATLMSDVPRAARDPEGAYQVQEFMIDTFCEAMLDGTHDVEFVRVARELDRKNIQSSVGLDEMIQLYYQSIRWEEDAQCQVGPVGAGEPLAAEMDSLP